MKEKDVRIMNEVGSAGGWPLSAFSQDTSEKDVLSNSWICLEFCG